MIGNLRGVSARGVEGNCSFRPSVIRLIAVRTSEELHRIRSFFGRRVQRILQNAADGPSNWKILSSENDPGVTTARLHPLGMDSQKVRIIRQEQPTFRCSGLQQNRVIDLALVPILRRDNVHSAPP